MSTQNSLQKGGNTHDPEIDLFDLTLMELSTKASPLMIENLRKHLESIRESKASGTTISSEIVDCCLLRLNQSMLLQDVLAMCYLINGGIVLSHHQSPSTTTRPPMSPTTTTRPHTSSTTTTRPPTSPTTTTRPPTSPTTTTRPHKSPTTTTPPHPECLQEEDLTSFEKMLESVGISSEPGDTGRLGEISPR